MAVKTIEKQRLAFNDNLSTGCVKSVITDEAGQVKATVIVTKAGLKNKNNRVYSRYSLFQQVEALQDDIRIGALFGNYGHPRLLFEKDSRIPARFDPKDKKTPKAFRVDKLWMEGDTVFSDIVFVDTEIGKRFAGKVERKEPLYVSLRAFGDCEEDPKTKTLYCDISDMEVFDIVDFPATVEAKAIYDSYNYQPILDSFDEWATPPDRTALEDDYSMMGEDPYLLSPEEMIALILAWGPDEQQKFYEILGKIIEALSSGNDTSLFGSTSQLSNNGDGGGGSSFGGDKGKQAGGGDGGSDTGGDQGGGGNDQNYQKPKNPDEAKKKKKGIQDDFKADPVKAAHYIASSYNLVDIKKIIKQKEKIDMPVTLSDAQFKELLDNKKGIAANGATEAEKRTEAEEAKKKQEKEEKEAAKAAKAIADEITETIDGYISDNQFENVTLSPYPENSLAKAAEIAKKKKTVAEANVAFADALNLIDVDESETSLREKGFTKRKPRPGDSEEEANKRKAKKKELTDGDPGTFNGRSKEFDTLEYTEGQEWRHITDKVHAHTVDYRENYSPHVLRDQEVYGNINKAFIDKLEVQMLESGLEKELQDAYEYQKGPAKKDKIPTLDEIQKIADSNDPVTIGNAQMKNQAFYGLEFMHELYKQVKSLEYMRAFPFVGTMGKVVRMPVITRQPPYNGEWDYEEGFFVKPDDAVSEMTFRMWWQHFSMRSRERSVRTDIEIVQTMMSGPIKFNVDAQSVAEMADEYAQEIDKNGYLALFLISDRFNSYRVGGEAYADYAAEVVNINEIVYNAGGPINTLDPVQAHSDLYGDSVTWLCTLRCAETTDELSDEPYPICRPEPLGDLDTEGEETEEYLDNIIVVRGGTTYVRGKFSSTMDPIPIERAGQAIPATAVHYAVNYKLRQVAAVVGAGFTTLLVPTISYTFSLNYKRYSLTPTPNTKPAEYYDSFLDTINGEAEDMWADRFARPNIMLATAKTMGRFLPTSDRWNKERSPESARLNPNFATKNLMGSWGNTDYVKVQQLPDGDKSGLLFLDKVVGYGVNEAPTSGGPYVGMIAPSGGGKVRKGRNWLRSYAMADTFGCPTVFTKNSAGKKIIKHLPFERIIFEGDVNFVQTSS